MKRSEVQRAIHAIVTSVPLPFDWVIEHAPNGDVVDTLVRTYRQARSTPVALDVLELISVESARAFCREMAARYDQLGEYNQAEQSRLWARPSSTSPAEHDWRIARVFTSRAHMAFMLGGGRNFPKVARELIPPEQLRREIAARLR